jgi:hypothetical protein
MDIGFEECQADLAKGIIDVLFGDLALTPQPLEGELKLIG